MKKRFWKSVHADFNEQEREKERKAMTYKGQILGLLG
jgi:hypothetical protein